MTNPNRSIPTFRVFKNRVEVGLVSAITESDAQRRAVAKFGRCEVVPATPRRKLAAKGRVLRSDSSYSHGRSPYPVGDFAARRDAAIAEWKASQ